MSLADTITTAVQATVAQLKTDLAAAGASASAQLDAFVNQYGPISAQWGIDLAKAKLTDDTVNVDRLVGDLEDVAALAAAAAADIGITAEATGEVDLAAFAKTLLQNAAKVAVGTLVIA